MTKTNFERWKIQFLVRNCVFRVRAGFRLAWPRQYILTFTQQCTRYLSIVAKERQIWWLGHRFCRRDAVLRAPVHGRCSHAGRDETPPINMTGAKERHSIPHTLEMLCGCRLLIIRTTTLVQRLNCNRALAMFTLLAHLDLSHLNWVN